MEPVLSIAEPPHFGGSRQFHFGGSGSGGGGGRERGGGGVCDKFENHYFQKKVGKHGTQF